jgi:hypothetical protein
MINTIIIPIDRFRSKKPTFKFTYVRYFLIINPSFPRSGGISNTSVLALLDRSLLVLLSIGSSTELDLRHQYLGSFERDNSFSLKCE